jgi:hypothetical protein
MTTTSDITIVYYSAEVIPNSFRKAVLNQLLEATRDLPMVMILKDPETPRNHFQIYRQALKGAKQATTRYIAMAEDDVLYSPEHFKYRPKNRPFAYNLGYWGIYTWQDPPIFNYKGRRNMDSLICDRLAFIEAMEERFAKYPNPDDSIKDIWAEPSKYEKSLGVTPQEHEVFYTNPPNIKFSHPTELSFGALGTRKRAGELRATEIPYWGHARDVRSLYD